MLPEKRLSVVTRSEKAGAEIQITKQHRGCCRKNRDRQQKKNRGDEQSPDWKRQSEHRHPGRPHIDDRGDIVHRPGDGGQAINKETHTPEALACLRSVVLSVRGERSVRGPSTSRKTGRNKKAGQ